MSVVLARSITKVLIGIRPAIQGGTCALLPAVNLLCVCEHKKNQEHCKSNEEITYMVMDKYLHFSSVLLKEVHFVWWLRFTQLSMNMYVKMKLINHSTQQIDIID